jgi:hypothetical protein
MKTDINLDGSLSAVHEGILRPIVVEASSQHEAMLALAESLNNQKAEEYAFFESMTARSLSLYGDPKQ